MAPERSKQHVLAVFNAGAVYADKSYPSWVKFQELLEGSTDEINAETVHINLRKPDVLYGRLKQFYKQPHGVAVVWGGGGTLARFLSAAHQVGAPDDYAKSPIIYVPGGKDQLRHLPYATSGEDPLRILQTIQHGTDQTVSCMHGVFSWGNYTEAEVVALRSMGINTESAKMIRKLPWEKSIIQASKTLYQALRDTPRPSVTITSHEEDIYEGPVLAAEIYNIRRSLYDQRTIQRPQTMQLVAIPADDTSPAGMTKLLLGLTWEEVLANTRIPLLQRGNPFLIKANSPEFRIQSPKGTIYHYDGIDAVDNPAMHETYVLKDVVSLQTHANPGVRFRTLHT